MKKIYVFLILIPLASFGQKISFSELLEKSNCKSFECFNDFITDKGFSFYGAEESEGTTMYIFTSDIEFSSTTEPNLVTKNICLIGFNESNCQVAGLRTVVKPYYEELLKQIKSNGFFYSNTTKDEFGVHMNYILKSNPKILIIVSLEPIEKEGLKFTEYAISIDRCR